MFLTLRNVVKRFGAVTALDDVSLDIAEGEFVCFLGPSGCGKTTLLRVIAGLEAPDAGAILLTGRELAGVSARSRNFGIVFQSYSLFPNMTVARNVAYGLECRAWERAAIAGRVREMLDLVDLADQAHKYPHQLSGGQQQRIALARALAAKPVVLLLDEPLSALDAKVREDLRGEVKDLQSRLSITTIMVTHDQHEAMEVADRIVVMNAGKVAQVGSGADLYARPDDPFVAGFLGRMNKVTAAFAPAAARAAGSFLGVRPEDVEIEPTGTPANGMPVADIEKCVFLGSCTRVTLRIAEDRLLVELRGKRIDLAPGGRVAVRIPDQALHRLPE
ncbi:MAG: ATP-binding cassette domain-containing protein [Burkholderiales bacterium]|nr:ATP-binding cassette domain-containing protein [Burkholderiales bacterium]